MQVDQIRKVRAAIRDGDLECARSIASNMVRRDSGDPVAWLLLSIVVEEQEKKIFCLEKVAQLTPDRGVAKLAQSWLSRVKMDQIKIDHLQPNVTQQPQKGLVEPSSPLGLDVPKVDRFDRMVGNRACPFLGMVQDPESHTMIPDKDNRCFRTKASLSIDLSHQNRFCLKDDYLDCHIYIYGFNEATTQTFRDLESESDQRDLSPLKILFFVILGISVLVILYIIYSSSF